MFAAVEAANGPRDHVAPPAPLKGIHAAVTRTLLDGHGRGSWIPEQRITLDEALIAYTRGAAFASFDEHDKGMLTPGALADVTIIDRDLFAVPPEEIHHARVTTTIVGGRIVFGPRRS